jgi:hypothetical protein
VEARRNAAKPTWCEFLRQVWIALASISSFE